MQLFPLFVSLFNGVGEHEAAGSEVLASFCGVSGGGDGGVWRKTCFFVEGDVVHKQERLRDLN